MIDIAVVDYGMGNLRSVAKALEHVAPSKVIAVTSDPAAIREAGRVVWTDARGLPARAIAAEVLRVAQSGGDAGLHARDGGAGVAGAAARGGAQQAVPWAMHRFANAV